MRWIKLIGDIHHTFKTDNFGNGLIHYPDHINGAANPDNGCGGFYLKSPLLELHQVFCKYLELAHHYPEFGVSFLFVGIELKLVQMEICLFTHGHKTAVFK